MENTDTLDDLFDQLDALFEQLDDLYDQQNALWDKLVENATDEDGDGEPDIDESSEEYQQILALDEQIDAIWEKVDALYEQVDEALGDEGIDDEDFDFGDINLIEGTEGADTLTGTDGMDDILAGAGDDVLDGGAGEDLLIGGEGSDTMTGGDGADWFVLEGGGNDVIKDFNAEEDVIDLSGTGVGRDDLTTEATDNGLQVSWNGGSVLLEGVTGEASDDWFLTDDDFDDDWADGNDDGNGDGSDDDFDDWGDFGINVVEGTDEADTLNGTDGYDDLYGGAGNDVLNGGADIDYLFGEAGNDTLTGGADTDVFFFDENAGNDVITDFSADEDILDFSLAGISADDLTITQQDGGTLISWGENTVFLEGFTGELGEEQMYFDGF